MLEELACGTPMPTLGIETHTIGLTVFRERFNL